MNKYRQLIKRYRKALTKAGLTKTASDAADLLENPLFGYPTDPKADIYSVRNIAEIREGFYNTLCSAFSAASLPLPPLEPQFYESLLAEKVQEKDAEEVRRIDRHIQDEISRIKNRSSLSLINTISLTLQTFPGCRENYDGITRRKFVAKLNQLLISEGCSPIRPDYSAWKNNGASKMATPEREIRLVVLDDDMDDMVKSLKSLIGWEKVTLIPYKHLRAGNDTEPAQSRMVELAKKILELEPDIILMDQGIDNEFSGSDLVPVIRSMSQKPIKFVANTGGDSLKLEAAGTYENCIKGEKIGPVAKAIAALGK